MTQISAIMNTWRSVETDPPAEGTLCIVYSPLANCPMLRTTSGPLAIAYKTAHGWKMADEPTNLRGHLALGPDYWQPFSI